MDERGRRQGSFLLAAAVLLVLPVQGCLSTDTAPLSSEPPSTAQPATSAGSQTAPSIGKETPPRIEGKEARASAQSPKETIRETASLPDRPHLRPAVPPSVLPAPSGPGAEIISGYRTPGECLVLRSRHYPDAVVAVTLPEDYYSNPEKKYPLVIAFGGAGECAKPPRSGALAWMHYYRTDEAVRALSRNRLTAEDFRGLVKPSRLTEYNTALEKRPYRGIILACPYSPPLSPLQGLEFPKYEKYIMEELIPELERRYRVASGEIGVDGVSMGGSRSMYYGFKYPEVFRSIGSVQGAFGPHFDMYADLVKKNRSTLKERSIQLVTSDGDVMAPAVARMHKLLEANGIPHTYAVLTGPHDYIFNQGPGSIALLVFHNSALQGRSAGPIR